ncbi:uncharacterized protein LOC124159429 [Ischnura elegans]|uniref:uncharacterized protein LOC124159429 n=1 Tax=Ischnura elegans TaxID=197161 RepID=UPI001ED8A2AB|nr:uncharacterized protein LOC124159429 [Ischnura elegans]
MPAKKRIFPPSTSCSRIMTKWRLWVSPWILLLVVAVTSSAARRGGAKGGDVRHGHKGLEPYELEDSHEKVDGEDEVTEDGGPLPWALGEGGSGDPLCPTLKPRPRPTKALCDAKPCLAHDRCPPESQREEEGGDSACCYNGCVYTCMRRMPSPPAFDWVEETPLSPAENASHQADEDHVTKVQSRTPPETIVLAGGCMLSTEEYNNLEKFRQSEHIKKCYCKSGDVLCEVDRGKT